MTFLRKRQQSLSGLLALSRRRSSSSSSSSASSSTTAPSSSQDSKARFPHLILARIAQRRRCLQNLSPAIDIALQNMTIRDTVENQNIASAAEPITLKTEIKADPMDPWAVPFGSDISAYDTPVEGGIKTEEDEIKFVPMNLQGHPSSTASSNMNTNIYGDVVDGIRGCNEALWAAAMGGNALPHGLSYGNEYDDHAWENSSMLLSEANAAGDAPQDWFGSVPSNYDTAPFHGEDTIQNQSLEDYFPGQSTDLGPLSPAPVPMARFPPTMNHTPSTPMNTPTQPTSTPCPGCLNCSGPAHALQTPQSDESMTSYFGNTPSPSPRAAHDITMAWPYESVSPLQICLNPTPVTGRSPAPSPSPSAVGAVSGGQQQREHQIKRSETLPLTQEHLSTLHPHHHRQADGASLARPPSVSSYTSTSSMESNESFVTVYTTAHTDNNGGVGKNRAQSPSTPRQVAHLAPAPAPATKRAGSRRGSRPSSRGPVTRQATRRHQQEQRPNGAAESREQTQQWYQQRQHGWTSLSALELEQNQHAEFTESHIHHQHHHHQMTPREYAVQHFPPQDTPSFFGQGSPIDNTSHGPHGLVSPILMPIAMPRPIPLPARGPNTAAELMQRQLEERMRKDQFLLEQKRAGLTYREIRRLGNFREAESTLRGRHRTLTKPKEERVRKPTWTVRDERLLKRAVHRMGSLSEGRKSSKISWKAVAEYIYRHGGSYHFGNTTCRKRWDFLTGKKEEGSASEN